MFKKVFWTVFFLVLAVISGFGFEKVALADLEHSSATLFVVLMLVIIFSALACIANFVSLFEKDNGNSSEEDLDEKQQRLEITLLELQIAELKQKLPS